MSLRKLLFIGLSAVFLAGCSLPSLKTNAGLQISIAAGEKANVFVDGINVGQTPYTGDEFKPGRKTVKLVPETADRATYEATVTLTPGNITVIAWTFGATLDESGGEIFELSKGSNKDKSELSVVTNPDNIIVKVDGQSKGFSPLILDDLSEGSHTLTVTAPGYVERTSNPKLLKGYRLTVTSKLAREPFLQNGGETTPSPSPAAVAPSPTPKATPKPLPSVTPSSSSSSSATSSNIISSSTATLPYVQIQKTGSFENGVEWLRVRAQASASGQELAKVSVGSKFPYLETVSGWHKIEYQTGKQGWVSGQYATVVKE